MTIPLEVVGVGMVTSLGSSTGETLAALERGERNISTTRLVDLRGDRIVGAFVLPIRDELTGPVRAELLLVPALVECAEAAPLPSGPIALFLCVPLPQGPCPATLRAILAPSREDWGSVLSWSASELEKRGAHVPPSLRVIVARGHAGGVLALKQAAEMLQRGEAVEAWIVGVDSHGERATLERLDVAGALRSRRSPGGFHPGEAAATIRVRLPSGSQTGRAVLYDFSVASETVSPSRGEALTTAVSNALAIGGCCADGIGTVAIDLNGERARAMAWHFASMRAFSSARSRPVPWCPAATLGDVGAASIPVLIGLTSKSPLSSSATLLVASSLDGLRAASVLVPGNGESVESDR